MKAKEEKKKKAGGFAWPRASLYPHCASYRHPWDMYWTLLPLSVSGLQNCINDTGVDICIPTICFAHVLFTN